jgi:hypothetical protein
MSKVTELATGQDAGDGAAAVGFEVELAFEGVLIDSSPKPKQGLIKRLLRS